MEYIIYLLVTGPWIIILCQLIGKWHDYAEPLRMQGVKHPIVSLVKSLPARFVKWCVAFNEAMMYGSIGKW